MSSKDGRLSLGWLLIALLNAHLMQAYADHRLHVNANNGEGWGYAQPSRPIEYPHPGSHHRHGYHPIHHHDATAPGFARGAYGGGVYAGQPGVWQPRDGVANEAQPAAGYGCVCGQLPETANGQGQAGFSNPAWPRYPETRPSRPFEVRPFQPQQPNPLDYEHEQRNNPNEPSFTGNPLQPRPQPGGQHTSEFSYQQPSYIGNPLQPRPQPGQDPLEPNFLQPGFAGKPLQPRPEGHGHDELEYQTSDTLIPQPGNTANPLQPRPEVAASGQAGLGEAANVLQPHPTNSNTFDSQLSDEPTKHSSNLRAASSYRNTSDQKSDPSSIVDENIASIFQTDFQGSKDPKGKAIDTQPESIGERNLFDTNPICSRGTELRGGHCRQKA